MQAEYLSVFWDEILVGRIAKTRAGRMRFQYDQSWLKHATAAPISLSLPLQEVEFGYEISTHYFENILPEEDAREALARATKLQTKDAFGFLRKFGRECAGALVILPEGASPEPDNEYEDVTERLHEILRERMVLGSGAGLVAATGARLSLAGAQDKLPVKYEDGRFYLPVQYAATTHIIKPESFRFHGLALNEFFCMRLARHMGLIVPDHEIIQIGDTPLYLSRRFDRETTPEGTVKRIHQEDFCQALGMSNLKKYEASGGPGFRQCMDLVDLHHFADRHEAPRFFTDAAIANVLFGNNDAHAKNFSILHQQTPTLAPLYDLVSTEIYPGLDRRVSMAIGGRFAKERIRMESWERFAHDVGCTLEDVTVRIRAMSEDALEQLPQTLAECAEYDPQGAILERLKACVERNAEVLLHITQVAIEESDADMSPS